MTEAQFNKYYKKYYIEKRSIQRLARKLSKNNKQIYQELVQVGLISLWKLVPSNATTNEDAWIRQALKFKMIDFMRKEFKHAPKLVSLDALLATGDQIEKDPETGFPHLVRNPGRKDFIPKDFLAPTNRPTSPGADAEEWEEGINGTN